MATSCWWRLVKNENAEMCFLDAVTISPSLLFFRTLYSVKLMHACAYSFSQKNARPLFERLDQKSLQLKIQTVYDYLFFSY